MKRWMTAMVVAVLALIAVGSVASAAGPGDRGRRAHPDGERVRILSGALGMEPREIVAALRDGQTIADLAAARDVSLDALAADLSAPRRERLAGLVEEGLLTQAQADYLNAEADERLTQWLTLPTRQALHARALDELATVLGISREGVVAQLEGGATLSEIVTGAGQSVEAVVAGMVALRDAKLDERVALDLMTETQQRFALAKYEAFLTARLSEK